MSNRVLRLSDIVLEPYKHIASLDNTSRYNFVMGGRGSFKSSTVADISVCHLNVYDNVSVIFVVKQKNKHYSTTYKSLRNSFRKFGLEKDWCFSGTEKTTPYIYREDPKTKKRQEILFRGVSTPEDIDKVLSLEGDRMFDDGKYEQMDVISTRWIVVIDEIQTLPNDLAETIFTKLDDSLRGNTGSRGHQFFFVGNPPKSKRHFLNVSFNQVFGSNKIALKKTMEEKMFQETHVLNFLGHSAHFLRTCYKNVPTAYIGEAFVQKMEYYRQKAPDKYLVEGLGIYVEGTSEVFDQFTPSNIFSFRDWVATMGGEAKAKLVVRNLMLSGTWVFFENADTAFLDLLADMAIGMQMSWLNITGPYNEKGKPNSKMKVIYRTTGVNDAYENKTLMISDRCPMLIQETREAVYDQELKEKKGILQRLPENDHGLDGLEYLLSGHWLQWKNSRLVFQPQDFQMPMKFVAGGDFGDGGASKEGDSATTCYVGFYSPAYRRMFVLEEYYHKNANYPRDQRISSKTIAIRLLNTIKDFAEGRW